MFKPTPLPITPWMEWVLWEYSTRASPFNNIIELKHPFVLQKCMVLHFYELKYPLFSRNVEYPTSMSNSLQVCFANVVQQWQRLKPLCPRKIKDPEFGSKSTSYDPDFHFFDQTLQVQRSRISLIFEIKLLLKMHRTCVSASERKWTRSSVLTRLVKLRFFLPT